MKKALFSCMWVHASAHLSPVLLSPLHWGFQHTHKIASFLRTSDQLWTAALCLHRGPIQQPIPPKKDWTCNLKNVSTQQRPLLAASPSLLTLQQEEHFQSSLEGKVWHQIIISHGLLWHSRREDKKGRGIFSFPAFHLKSVFHFSLSSFYFPSKLIWHTGWAAFIAASLKGHWFRFLNKVCVSFWEWCYYPLW